MTERHETHLVEYPFEGAIYGFEIQARDSAEAERRVKALVHARHIGRLDMTINAALPRFVADAIVWLKNWRDR